MGATELGVGRWGGVRNEAKGSDISRRLLALSVGVIRMSEKLPKTPWARHVAMQVLRASSSAGANYQEACYAESRADFVHKVSVAAKELAETLYWLQLIGALGLLPDSLPPLARETDELIAILVASSRTARQSL